MKNNVKISSDGICKFYEKSHSYYIGKKKLISATELIHRHFPIFDEKALAKKMASFGWAKLQKKGVRYWLAEWKKNRQEGSLCHAEIEKYLTEEGSRSLLGVFHPRSQSAIKFLEEFLEQYKMFYEFQPEKLLHGEGVAGQADLVLIDEDMKTATIVDWKFTKRIKKDSYEPGETGTTPITSHLVNCNYNTYSLQLSVYAYLLELEGYVVEDLVLVHVDPNGVVTPYAIDYHKNIVKQMLEGVKNE